MQISDSKKEIEIEITGTRSYNGRIVANFRMNITRPVQVQTRFDVTDIKTIKGVEGINFSKDSPLAMALKVGNNTVHLSIPNDALAWIKAENEKYIAALRAEAQAKKTTVWYWNTADENYRLDIIPDISMDFRDDLKEVMQVLENNQARIIKDLIAHSKPASADCRLRNPEIWMEVPAELVEGWARDIMAAQKARDAEIESRRNTPEARAKRDEQNKRTSAIMQQWADEEEMENGRVLREERDPTPYHPREG
jgi:DNA-binding cell septation regulator SpoVG